MNTARAAVATSAADVAVPAGGSAATRPGRGACEHRETERRDGKTYCKACKAQLYL